MLTAFHLAFKEIWRNRARFLLFGLVVALITLLILFIAALGEGLGSGNREYLQKLNGELIVYQDTARLSIAASLVGCGTRASIRSVEGVQDEGPIGFSSASVVVDGTPSLDVSLIGVAPGQPGEPPSIKGAGLARKSGRETVIDRTVAQVVGAEVGDTITIRTVQGGEDEFYDLQVVGISESRKYAIRPSIFVPIVTWDEIRAKARPGAGAEDPACNVVAVRLEDPSQIEVVRQRIQERIDGVEAVDRKMAYENTPGYTAQQSTLNTQNGFALLIGVLVIGGFFQIQTLQKVGQIGMLKAIGTPNSVVALAVLIQIIFTTLMGVTIGSLSSFGLSLLMPPGIPIIFEPFSSVRAIVSILLMGPLGGLVSIRYSLRVEPLIALGLS